MTAHPYVTLVLDRDTRPTADVTGLSAYVTLSEPRMAPVVVSSASVEVLLACADAFQDAARQLRLAQIHSENTLDGAA